MIGTKRANYPKRNFEEAACDDEEDSDVVSDESAVIGFWSAFVWLVLMTGVIALLSEYVLGTIEAASDSWGLSVNFISEILLPIVGNAAEHAAAVIFAFKNKLDISLGVALESATQIAMFVDGTSHYLKGLVLLLCYLVIGASFFIFRTTNNHADTVNISFRSSNEGIMGV
ncbi:Vacuolar cation/proton exchanger 3 [Abeliophyllum distichum]|uniref:Vacuolar cation/proton exchanger 3 n=1 Tax=Abeliophyllum distichum TaxID=126358 RepID=A0ABD1QTD3_9LAMI